MAIHFLLKVRILFLKLNIIKFIKTNRLRQFLLTKSKNLEYPIGVVQSRVKGRIGKRNIFSVFKDTIIIFIQSCFKKSY